MTPPKNPNDSKPNDSKSNGQSSRQSVTTAMRRASEARLEQLRREGEMLHLTRATGIRPALPAALSDLLERRERVVVLPNDLGAVIRFICAHARRVGNS